MPWKRMLAYITGSVNEVPKRRRASLFLAVSTIFESCIFG
jgi:hypothetical protein